MPAINPQDLNNAKLDVDHMAALATSAAPTAVDRFGQTKKTWSGLESELNAEYTLTAAAASRSGAEAAQGGALAAKVVAETASGIALARGRTYATKEAGVNPAGTPPGVGLNEFFTVPSAMLTNSLELYQNVGGAAVLQVDKSIPSTTAVIRPSWTGKKNGWPDPFFRQFNLGGASFLGRARWFGPAGNEYAGWSLAKSQAFDGQVLKRGAGVNSTYSNGPVLWLDEMGAAVGDTITLYQLITGSTGGSVTGLGRFISAAGAVLGTNILGTRENGAIGLVPALTPAYLRASAVVPADAVAVRWSAYNANGATDFEVVSVWGFKGTYADGPSWPTLDNTSGEDRILALENTSVKTNAAHEIRNGVQPYITYKHVLGDAEMVGDSNYSVLRVVGAREQVVQATLFNALQYRIWAANSTTAVDWRIYVRDNATAFNPSAVTPIASGTITAGNFPVADALYTLALDEPVLVDAGKVVFILFHAADDSTLRVKRWLYNAAITPARHGFPYHSTAGVGWNALLLDGAPTTGFGQTAIKLMLQSIELRDSGGAGGAYNNASSGLTATTLQGAVDELAGGVSVILPPKIYALQGLQANVYLDSIIQCSDYRDFDFDVNNTAAQPGRQLSECWRLTPTGPTTGTLSISVHDKRSGRVLGSASAALLAAAATAGAGTTKRLLLIGDSLGNQTVVNLGILADSDAMACSRLGTQGAAPNLHEARGGWSLLRYTTDYPGNPFWISGAVNFAGYLAANSVAVPDWVVIALGTNDCLFNVPWGTDATMQTAIDAELSRLDVLIASVKAADAATKIVLMPPPPPSFGQDAFGIAYDTGEPRWKYKRRMMLWTRRLYAKYAGQEAARIFVSSSGVDLDSQNNMPRAAAEPVNSRSAITVQRQGDAVHPATEGYKQRADGLWAFLKNNT